MQAKLALHSNRSYGYASLQSGAFEHGSCACSRDPGEKCGPGCNLFSRAEVIAGKKATTRGLSPLKFYSSLHGLLLLMSVILIIIIILLASNAFSVPAEGTSSLIFSDTSFEEVFFLFQVQYFRHPRERIASSRILLR